MGKDTAIPLLEKFGEMAANFLISIAAALVRLFFAPGKSFRDSLLTFGGSVVCGVLVGYLIQPIAWLHNYNNGIVATAGAAGRELFLIFLKKAPSILIQLLAGAPGFIQRALLFMLEQSKKKTSADDSQSA